MLAEERDQLERTGDLFRKGLRLSAPALLKQHNQRTGDLFRKGLRPVRDEESANLAPKEPETYSERDCDQNSRKATNASAKEPETYSERDCDVVRGIFIGSFKEPETYSERDCDLSRSCSASCRQRTGDLFRKGLRPPGREIIKRVLLKNRRPIQKGIATRPLPTSTRCRKNRRPIQKGIATNTGTYHRVNVERTGDLFRKGLRLNAVFGASAHQLKNQRPIQKGIAINPGPDGPIVADHERSTLE